jgi:hypothetical protein
MHAFSTARICTMAGLLALAEINGGSFGAELGSRSVAGAAPNAATPASDPTADGNDKDGEIAAPKNIKEVMRFTMTKGLCQKVIKKSASPEEQKQLVELFKAMAAMTPPLGEAESWKSKSNALIDAAKEVAEGKPSHAALAKAANCAACHKDHRPK